MPRTLTKTETSTITVRVPREDYEKLTQAAGERHLTVTEFVRRALAVQLFLSDLEKEEEPVADSLYRRMISRLR